MDVPTDTTVVDGLKEQERPLHPHDGWNERQQPDVSLMVILAFLALAVVYVLMEIDLWLWAHVRRRYYR
jgi:hypothetical protein